MHTPTHHLSPQTHPLHLWPGLARIAGASLLLTLLAASPARAELKTGDTAPDFHTAAARAGQQLDYRLREGLRQGPVVVYFFPSAFTQGCNIQAHEFAERLPQFEAAGATVVGVSLDNLPRLLAFSAEPGTCAGKFTVASDADGQIARSYALQVREAPSGRNDTRGQPIDHGLAERTTFVVRPDGSVAQVIGGLSPVDNVTQALQAVQGLSTVGSPGRR